MPVEVTNLGPTFVLLQLNSGTSLRLSPGQTSEAIPDVEVTNNPKVAKMQAQRLIAVEQLEERSPEAAAAEMDVAPAEPAKEREAGGRSRSSRKSGPTG